MAKENAHRPQENPRKISPEHIAWDPSVSARNREVVEVLCYLGDVTSRNIVMPGTKEQPYKVHAPTRFKISGVEVFVASYGNGFFQTHVDGKDANPVPFPKEASTEELVGKIGKEIRSLQDHLENKKTTD